MDWIAIVAAVTKGPHDHNNKRLVLSVTFVFMRSFVGLRRRRKDWRLAWPIIQIKKTGEWRDDGPLAVANDLLLLLLRFGRIA
jgi:hypothetical protein